MTSDGQEENVPACGNLVDSFPEELYITSQAGFKAGTGCGISILRL